MARRLLLALCLILQVYANTTYSLVNMTKTNFGFQGTLSLTKGDDMFGKDIATLNLQVYFERDSRLRVKLTDPSEKRWEVPDNTIVDHPSNYVTEAEASYVFTYKTSPFSFKVVRKSDKEVLFNSDVQSAGLDNLIFENQFLQLSTLTPKGSGIYGAGEHISNMRLKYGNYSAWAEDYANPTNTNLYGTFPLWVDVRSGGNTHGSFFRNSNAQQTMYFNADNDNDVLTFRTIGGVIDLYIFTGTTPRQVVDQYTTLVGRGYLPPYWSLGFHQCRYGYHNLEELKEVVRNYSAAGIPLETMWTDIDYMDQLKDFTFDPVRFPTAEMKKWVDELHQNGQHYVFIVDPGIKIEDNYAPYSDGNKLDIWIKNSEGTPFIGKVWPGKVVFEDWFAPNSFPWWQKAVNDTWNQVPFDGMWIDMNELSNFCDGECDKKPVPPSTPDKYKFNPNFPPFQINNRAGKSPLWQATVALDAVHHDGLLEYDVHNLFGYMEMWATTVALRNVRKERALVISRSTYAGAGRHGGHWTGDNASTWPDLYLSIPDVLNFNMFGITLIGADICGFGGDTTEELCARWIQLGAFYTFSRNHNSYGNKPQELYRWPSVAKIGKEVLEIRYNILPYYYTLLWETSKGYDSSVLRPLWFEFPESKTCLDVDRQLLVGKGFLITPVLDQGATKVSGYFPPSENWFDYHNHRRLVVDASGQVTLDAPLEKLNIHFRGGLVLPRQGSASVLRDAVQKPYNLLVAFDKQGQASGSLYLDDGVTIDVQDKYTHLSFTGRSSNGVGKLAAEVVHAGFTPAASALLEEVTVLGCDVAPTSVTFNGKSVAFVYDKDVAEVKISGLGHAVTGPFNLVWK